jgi:hypothetical protein
MIETSPQSAGVAGQGDCGRNAQREQARPRPRDRAPAGAAPAACSAQAQIALKWAREHRGPPRAGRRGRRRGGGLQQRHRRGREQDDERAAEAGALKALRTAPSSQRARTGQYIHREAATRLASATKPTHRTSQAIASAIT